MSSSAFYNTIANYYNTYCATSGIETFTEEELHLLEMYSPSSVLEFGIGTGRFTKAYLERNKDTEYVGVDNAEEMLRHAKDSGATLVLANFEDYIEHAIQEEKTFDCIIAPYTALHHIETKKQTLLLKQMKKVAHTIILNCLNEKEEEKIFGNELEKEVHFRLPKKESASTTIYKIHHDIRSKAKIIPSGVERQYLVFTDGTV